MRRLKITLGQVIRGRPLVGCGRVVASTLPTSGSIPKWRWHNGVVVLGLFYHRFLQLPFIVSIGLNSCKAILLGLLFTNEDYLIEEDRQCLQYKNKPVIDAKGYITYGLVMHEVERLKTRIRLDVK